MFNLNHAAQLTLNLYYVVQCLILQNFTEELCQNFKSAKEWVKCSDYKVKIVHSLGIGTISIMMIHSLMAGAMMDRSERFFLVAALSRDVH